MPVALLPIAITASLSSFWRPVMNTYAPSFDEELAVANPMPCAAPVILLLLPLGLSDKAEASSVRWALREPSAWSNPAIR
jgi:hypothetical protein